MTVAVAGTVAQGVELGLERILLLPPLQETVQVIPQLHLGLEHIGLHPLSGGIAGFGDLDHLFPKVFVFFGYFVRGKGQGKTPIGLDNLGPGLVEFIEQDEIIGPGLLLGNLGAKPPLSRERKFLGEHRWTSGSCLLIKGKGVRGQIEKPKGQHGIVQGPGRTDSFLGGLFQVGQSFDLGIGLQGFIDISL